MKIYLKSNRKKLVKLKKQKADIIIIGPEKLIYRYTFNLQSNCIFRGYNLI
jgi:hypothetical protein